ncbi:SRPBCC family protein [Sutcliffiella horikoshii]|uniref:SRPBCC family protein n=1 Tax=Sutcliffiella horikoshii TaxID=79883 RepID=UPI00165378B7|nr:SRPBCC domain-containing protein [Sutcliffiella horikoshii]
MPNDYHAEITLPIPALKLYHSVSTEEGVRSWWTVFTKLEHEVGGTAEFRFPKAGFYVKAEITELVPNQLVEWKVIDSLHPESSGFQSLRDWEGTVIRFEIQSVTEKVSVLQFTHVGLNEELECFDACQRGWTSYLTSLQNLVVSGKGTPYKEEY